MLLPPGVCGGVVAPSPGGLPLPDGPRTERISGFLHTPSDQVAPRCCGARGGRTANETRVGNRGVDSDGLLEEAVEEQTPMASRTAVESKGGLGKVVRQIRSVWPALVRPKPPSVSERCDTMGPWPQC